MTLVIPTVSVRLTDRNDVSVFHSFTRAAPPTTKSIPVAPCVLEYTRRAASGHACSSYDMLRVEPEIPTKEITQ